MIHSRDLSRLDLKKRNNGFPHIRMQRKRCLLYASQSWERKRGESIRMTRSGRVPMNHCWPIVSDGISHRHQADWRDIRLFLADYLQSLRSLFLFVAYHPSRDGSTQSYNRGGKRNSNTHRLCLLASVDFLFFFFQFPFPFDLNSKIAASTQVFRSGLKGIAKLSVQYPEHFSNYSHALQLTKNFK